MVNLIGSNSQWAHQSKANVLALIDEKESILELADFVMSDDITKSDLKNKRKKWIRFNAFELTQVIGELSYHFNRSENDFQFHFLDQLICHLEFYEKR